MLSTRASLIGDGDTRTAVRQWKHTHVTLLIAVSVFSKVRWEREKDAERTQFCTHLSLQLLR